jgi:molybdate transport system regulatory protein
MGDEREAGIARFDARLTAAGVQFGADDATLLRAIDEAGSLNAATDTIGRSYSRSHKRLGELEAAFGPLVESQRGGAGGGGSALTDEARRLLARFGRLQTEFAGVADVDETVFEGHVVERTGELAVVETDAGRLRALAPPDVTAVYVTVRADTVVIHDVDAAPTPSETSARNRFTGTVVDVDEREAIASIGLDIGTDRPLVALATAASTRALDLRPGSAVVGSFKTTATRATPREYR